jgi:thiol-disulfide isomerase/thioredoxin
MRAALVVATLAALGTPALRAQDVGLDLGTTPRPALVQDMAGEVADLSQLYVGKKPVLIEFWATWCPICAKLLPRMEAAQRRYGSRVEFVVIGVGVNETRESMRRHLERHAMPFRFYFDNAGAAVRAFETPSTSYIVALDASGRVVYTGVGEDQDIEAAARRAATGR